MIRNCGKTLLIGLGRGGAGSDESGRIEQI